MKYWSSGD